MKAFKALEMPANDISCRNKVVMHVGKDFHKFGRTEKQARKLLRVVVEYLGKPGKYNQT